MSIYEIIVASSIEASAIGIAILIFLAEDKVRDTIKSGLIVTSLSSSLLFLFSSLGALLALDGSISECGICITGISWGIVLLILFLFQFDFYFIHIKIEVGFRE